MITLQEVCNYYFYEMKLPLSNHSMEPRVAESLYEMLLIVLDENRVGIPKNKIEKYDAARHLLEEMIDRAYQAQSEEDSYAIPNVMQELKVVLDLLLVFSPGFISQLSAHFCEQLATLMGTPKDLSHALKGYRDEFCDHNVRYYYQWTQFVNQNQELLSALLNYPHQNNLDVSRLYQHVDVTIKQEVDEFRLVLRNFIKDVDAYTLSHKRTVLQQCLARFRQTVPNLEQYGLQSTLIDAVFGADHEIQYRSKIVSELFKLSRKDDLRALINTLTLPAEVKYCLGVETITVLNAQNNSEIRCRLVLDNPACVMRWFGERAVTPNLLNMAATSLAMLTPQIEWSVKSTDSTQLYNTRNQRGILRELFYRFPQLEEMFDRVMPYLLQMKKELRKSLNVSDPCTALSPKRMPLSWLSPKALEDRKRLQYSNDNDDNGAYDQVLKISKQG